MDSINQLILSINDFANFAVIAPPRDVIVYIFQIGGWVFFMGLIWWMAVFVFLQFRQKRYLMKNVKWVFLAVDVPKANEQTPKAVEQVFAQIAGSHKTPDFEERNWDGHMPYWFSFEIVSIEGYIQFIIGTPKKRRDLVESSIYAQYPDAEITEIEDYTKDFPTHFPNKEYQCFGAEFKISHEELYPIKTYVEFEHTGAEEIFKDPMAAFLEVFTRIGRGEHLWVQFLVKPLENDFLKEKGLKLIKQLIGAPAKHKTKLIHHISGAPIKALEILGDAVIGRPESAPTKKEEPPPSLMLYLSPGEKEKVEAVEKKVGKIPFGTKIRYVYIAKHEAFNRSKVSYGLVGAFKQYTSEHNGIKPDSKKTMTKTHFFFKETRDNERRIKLVSAYKARSRWLGLLEFRLNTEELATLWHFPVLTVKAPLLKKTEAKRVEPPISLPVEGGYLRPKAVTQVGAPPRVSSSAPSAPAGAPPSNLPI